MKLIEQYDKHQEIFNLGYRFDPEEEVFFSSKIKSFKKPKGYEDWEVKEFDHKKYLNDRLKSLGIKPEHNKINLWDVDEARADMPIFTANEHGDIEILFYDLKRHAKFYEKSKTSAGSRFEYHVQKRLNPLYQRICQGKYDFTEALNQPFWHPDLIDAFEKEEKIEQLVITEGQFKAFKATHDGIPTVGFTSISHFRNAKTKEVHTEIIEFIHRCGVEKIVILWDGDCRDISSKQLENEQELTKRPGQFFNYAKSIRNSIYKFFTSKKLKVYFATIKSDDIDGEPKGIDDLLICKGVKKRNVIEDFQRIGDIPGYTIEWLPMTREPQLKILRSWFKIDYASSFYEFHKERIKNNRFIFYGNTFRIEKGSPVMEVSADLKEYKLIGTDFYRLTKCTVPSGKEGETIQEERLIPWKPDIIKLQHGKDALHKLEVYKGFTNIPSHMNYQPVINNEWNLYYNVEHDKKEGDFPTIRTHLKHVFQEQYDMILDYITILYKNPMQKLPVVCLVSKEQGTGKSTFLFLLKLIFKQNMTFISNSEFTGDFNAHWTSKLIVASEETIFEKKDAYEKLKNLSTAKSVNRNEKNKSQSEIPNMLHFVLCSNHEKDFMKISKHDRRLWVRKVHPFKAENEKADLNFDDKLESEIPYFINFIENREVLYNGTGELYFHKKDFQTKAFHTLVGSSESTIVKEIKEIMSDYFLRYSSEEILVVAQDLKQYFGIPSRYENTYINKVLEDEFDAIRYEGGEKTRKYNLTVEDLADPDRTVRIKRTGRPYILKREMFIKPKKEAHDTNSN